HEGKISREKFVEINKDINERVQNLVTRKITEYKGEKEDLKWKQLDLDKDLEEELIIEREYMKKKDEIYKRNALLDSKINSLESSDDVEEYLVLKEKPVNDKERYLFSARLWSVLTLFGFAFVIGVIFLLTPLFVSTPLLSSVPIGYGFLTLSQLILMLFSTIIGVFLASLLMFIAASIAGIRDVKFNRALILTTAILVVSFGSEIIYSFLALGVGMISGIINISLSTAMDSIFGLIITISRLILVVSISIWIIREGFNTKWINAGVTWIFMLIISISLLFLFSLIFGSLF
ncbi:MAG: hypothetical protein KKH78_00920, partial [Candidatus Altiarchaeota archaeon]|nr:hypothetical protein [Candidatus Altiarchaeota archaeon]